ncbi:hypothetical protein COS91_04575 [Candidatus Desantisbacteria bacterium CG07_land_8_20_14_0_80_39_15]|uniref:Transglutaminase-like domain-containing protein n=2 Tax=unclassified Candidatus Desantisiibacteriota TaxID=3106372 RepID=A0A2H9PDA3_9BACT|nr:MAG: hypothetical protein COS91_04575 [Candidatus Desantisbacteria bacterium CG07_land_8_20_14_0_80_39_15]PIZ17401.1 MAG: hypothetical protein COY51_00210 [Candidatus Desantisbacteria bacterium CG_4_10_14_0_8_um_filter_39_17]
MKKVIHIGVITFWVIMMSLLILRNLPRKGKDEIRLTKISMDEEKMERDNWMGIYLKDKKIGYSHFVVTKEKMKNEDVYQVVDETFMKLKFGEQTYDAFITGKALLKKDLTPISFSMDIFTNVYKVAISGEIKGNKINVEILSGGSTFKKTFPFTKSTHLPMLLNIILPKQKLEIGKPYRLTLFDPEILAGDQYIIIILKKKEKIGNEDVMLIEKEYKGMKTTSWINMKGETIKEEDEFGMKILREPKEIALAKGKIEPCEIVKMSSIPSNMFIPAARKLSYLKVRMRGLRDFLIPDTLRQKAKKENGEVIVEIASAQRQEVAKWQSIPPAPELRRAGAESESEKYRQYLLPGPFIQSNDEKIVNMAVEITQDETQPWKKAKKLNQWVFNNIEKIPTFSIPSALSVLKEKKGDCNEHAVLLVALARACKIPSRITVGLAYLPPSGITLPGDKGSFFYHAWAEVYISEEWRELDPTFGQDIVDATHIKLLDGDMDKQVEILRVIGKLKIKVEDFK